MFEGLPESEARLWPERFMGAIPVGVDLDALRLVDRLAVARLRSLLDLAPSWAAWSAESAWSAAWSAEAARIIAALETLATETGARP